MIKNGDLERLNIIYPIKENDSDLNIWATTNLQLENILINLIIFVRKIILYNDAIVIFYNFTNLSYPKGIAPDNIKDFDLEQMKSELTTENDVNKTMDITIFYSKEYFAVLEKRNIQKQSQDI